MKDYRYYSKIIDEIEKVRKKNNKNWMDLLRLAFKLDSKNTSIIVKEIFKHDKKISSLSKKLVK